MNIEKIREQFVGWIESLNVGYDTRFAEFIGGLNDGEFYDAEVQGLWTTWQASRAAIEVELPEHFEYDNPGEALPAIKDCRKAIEAAGLKVKS